MPNAHCGNCGAECYISDSNRDAGAEVYCSEECADRPTAFGRAKSRLVDVVWNASDIPDAVWMQSMDKLQTAKTMEELAQIEREIEQCSRN